MRKNLTPEQIEKRDARRAKFAELAQKIGAMTDEQRTQIAAQMPVVTVEGRVLSAHNCCMVWMQNETATVVAGFQQWIKAGRCVRKGEHGLMIWAPRMSKSEETGEEERSGFVMITVFDVSQTDAIASEQEVA